LKRKQRSSSFRKVLSALKRGERFLIAVHRKPDGDTLGSALAIAQGLRSLGKKAQVFSHDPIPDTLQAILPGAKKVLRRPRPRARYDAAVLLECSTLDRCGPLLDFKTQVGTVINIDHHATSLRFGDINLIQPDFSSNAEQIYALLTALSAPIDRAIATCLYVGIVTDTGRFQFPLTTPRTLETAAALMKTGFPYPEINHQLFSSRPFASLKLLSHTLKGMSLVLNKKVALLSISIRARKKLGISLNHSEDFVNFGLMPPGVEVSILVKQEGKRTYVSLRSKGTVNVGKLAVRFGGGGHKKAAGFSESASPKSVQKRLLKAIAPLLPKSPPYTLYEKRIMAL